MSFSAPTFMRRLREQDDGLASWLLFLVPLGILIARRMLSSTGYGAAMNEIVTIDQVRWFVFGIVAVRELFFGRYDAKSCAILAVFVGLGLIAEHANYLQVVDALVFTFAARNLEFKKVALCCFAEILLILLVVLGSAYLGIIVDVVFAESSTRSARHALGFTHPNGAGAYLLCCIMLWAYMRENRFGLVDALCCIVAMLALFQFTDSRGSLLAVVAFVVVLLVFRWQRSLFSARRLFALGAGVVCLMAVSSIVLCACYTPESSWMQHANALLSGRLSLGHEALEMHGVTLFGQNIPLGTGHRFNFATQEWVDGNGYPIVDNVYVRLLVKCGVLFVIVSLALVIVSLKHFTAKPAYAAAVAAVVVALATYGVVESAPINLFQNPFLLLLAVPFGVRQSEDAVRLPDER